MNEHWKAVLHLKAMCDELEGVIEGLERENDTLAAERDVAREREECATRLMETMRRRLDDQDSAMSQDAAAAAILRALRRFLRGDS